MAKGQHIPIDGDRALDSGDGDMLAFREVASRIATALIDRASESGMVVGIDGEWGSGKSSLLFLIEEELKNLPEVSKPSVINFRPWLIGNRDALIVSLFAEFSAQLSQAALSSGDATPASIDYAKKAGRALNKFLNALGRVGALVEVAGDISGSQAVKLTGKAFQAAGKTVEKKAPPPQLAILKEKLAESLRKLGHRFVVTIDDVDRLEPDEVLELIRLVRSVADLPNVIYILCYDATVLARSIEHAAGIKDGRSYLEKIVQLNVPVPRPELFQLRQWFSDKLELIASPKNEDELDRLRIVIDYEGGKQLHTPRSVVRALDAVRFFWPALRDSNTDLPDLVWILLIKNGNPDLYRWIEDYCSVSAGISLGIKRVDDAEIKDKLDKLSKIVPENYFSNFAYRYYFSEHLPGINAKANIDGIGLEIFTEIGDQNKTILENRLSSPDHYKLYFSLTGPSHALTLKNFTDMFAAASTGRDEVGGFLLRLHAEAAAGSLTKADLMLERMRGGAHEKFTEIQCENILAAIAHVMDEASRVHPLRSSSLWDRAERLIPVLLGRLEADRRDIVVFALFEAGSAIGWLTSVFRREIFAHGRYGDRRRLNEEWLLRDKELDQVSEIMIKRYQKMSAADVFDCPDPIDLLFAWLQAGDEVGPRHLVQSNIATDEGLVKTLEKFITVCNTSKGNYNRLTRNNISPLFDYDNAVSRIHKIKDDKKLGGRAKILSASFID